MDYAYNGFNEPTQQANADRITQILQSKAPAPQADPQLEFQNAIAAFQAQNGVSQGQNQSYAQLGAQDKLGSLKQAVSSGDPQAAALDKRIKMFVGNDPAAYDSAAQFLIDHPNEIDPSNSFQANTALAQWSKQSGYSQQQSQRQALSPQQLSMQDMASIASGRGTDYFGRQRADEKALADLAASEALAGKYAATAAGGGGSGGVTQFVYNKTKAALEAAGVQITPEIELQITQIARNGLTKGATITVNGQQVAIENIIGAENAAAAMEGAKQDATNKSDLEYKPLIAGGEARAKPIGQNKGEKEALIGQMQARIPQLVDVTQRLSAAGKKATYTTAGRLWNQARLETGFDPNQEAVSRAEYIAIVDNEVLPLLRETFGAQFTQKEGESLKVTLGDPNKQPQEKDAVLRSFMRTKLGTINSTARELGRPEPFSAEDIQEIVSQINISGGGAAVAPSGGKSGWSIRKKQ